MVAHTKFIYRRYFWCIKTKCVFFSKSNFCLFGNEFFNPLILSCQLFTGLENLLFYKSKICFLRAVERDLRNEFRTEHRRFLPHFPKNKNRIRNQWTWGEIQGGSINDNKTYLIFWSPLRRPCETKLPKLAEINWVKKSCPSFWRPFSNSNINIAIELAFLGFYQLYWARSNVDGQTA